MSIRTTAGAASVVLLSLLLAACGGGGDGGQTTTGDGEGELTPVTIGTQPIVDSAPLYLGRQEGFFEEEGIDLSIESAQGGAAVIPSVVSGDFQFGRGNILSTMVAVDEGLPLRCIANANSATGVPDFGGVVVKADSPIKSVADLPGHTVSVNTLSNIGDTTIRTIIEEAGGNPNSIEFVEVGFPDAPAALETGQVDAAWIVDPFLTEAVDNGARVITYNFYEFHPELDVSCVFTTEQLIQRDPDLVERFTRAMNKSLEYSQENSDAVREVVGTYTEIAPDILERMVLPTFRPEFSREAAEKLGAQAVKYGTLSKAPNLDTLLPESNSQ